MKKGKTICIDFDGVIATYNGFKGRDVIGNPINGAKDATKTLKEEGYTIIIFTTRKAEDIKEWLKTNGITYDYINENPNQPKQTNMGKPIADLYLDDRAICFRGNWEWALRDIVYFEPYNKPDQKKEFEKIFDDYRKYSSKKQSESL